MNWYKRAQQQDFSFWSDQNNRSQYLDNRSPYKLTPPSLEEYDFKDAINDCETDSELENILKHFASNYEIISFSSGEKIISAVVDTKHMIISTGGYYKTYEPQEWIQNIVSYGNVSDYVDARDFSKEFWDGIDGDYFVYHGTSEENLPNILKRGLEPRDETRGINNRSTGAAVFTSETPEEAAYSYDKVLSINVGAMKQNGYMPFVSQEGPVEECEMEETLAHKIGIEDYYCEYEQGLSPTTIIFYGKIPAKYLKAVEN
jgi:hypothetical protein